MSASDTTSHFWIASDPFFSTTLLVAPESTGVSEDKACSSLELYDVDGVRVNSVDVEFPPEQVGVIELEPFMSALKMQGGVRHGHVALVSQGQAQHMCRYALHEQISLTRAPTIVRSRESCFVPLVIGGQREHVVALVNSGLETSQIALRVFYANRSPE